MGLTKDQKLLASESPQEQIDRMGNGWSLVEQYEKQLELPVHLQAQGMDLGGEPQRMVFLTVCGLAYGDQGMRSTDDPEDVTCQACGG